MEEASGSAAFEESIFRQITTIEPSPGTSNKNLKTRELEDSSQMRLEDFLREFEIGEWGRGRLTTGTMNSRSDNLFDFLLRMEYVITEMISNWLFQVRMSGS